MSGLSEDVSDLISGLSIDSSTTNTTSDPSKGAVSLATELNTCVTLLKQGQASSAQPILMSLASKVSSLALFSSNELLSDVTTSSLPFLSLPYHLAMCRTSLPEMDPKKRLEAIETGESLMKEYLSTTLAYELLEPDHKKAVEKALESDIFSAPPRDEKVAQFKSLHAAEAKIEVRSMRVSRKRDNQRKCSHG